MSIQAKCKLKYEGTTWETDNGGNLTVLEYHTYRRVLVSFNTTGHQKIVRMDHVKTGRIYDPFSASVVGVGFLGYNIRPLPKKAYSTWSDMLRRCYDPKCANYSCYGAKGVTVAEEFHNFQIFAEWYEKNYIEGFHLDKDLLQEGVKDKVYSKATCCFLSPSDNYSLKQR